jgi:hypothetical protein
VADATFEDVFDWFATHRGRRVVVEAGCSDPRTDHPTDFAVLRVFTTLGEPYMTNDPKRRVGVLRVSFVDNDIERGGIEVQAQCVKGAKIHAGLLKVWQHDVFFTVAPNRA